MQALNPMISPKWKDSLGVLADYWENYAIAH